MSFVDHEKKTTSNANVKNGAAPDNPASSQVSQVTDSPQRHLLKSWKLRWGLVAIAATCLVVIGTVALTRRQDANAREAANETSQAITRPIRVGVSRVDSIQPPKLATRFRGVVEARRQSNLAFRRSGRVAKVMVDEGDQVDAGATIAELDTSDLDAESDLAKTDLRIEQARYDEAVSGPRRQTIQAAEARVDQLRAQLLASKNRLNRRETLVRSRATSVEEYQDEKLLADQLAASVEEAESQLRELQEGTRAEQVSAARARVAKSEASIRVIAVRRDDSRIVAPFDCTIARRFADEGTIAGPDQTIVSIFERPPLEARFGLPAEEAVALTIGQTVSVSLGKNSGTAGVIPTLENIQRQSGTHRAKVVRMQPGLDPVTRTREVVVQFESDQPFVIGQSATLWLPKTGLEGQNHAAQKERPHGEHAATFWIPSDALVRGVRGLWALYVAAPAGETRDAGALAEQHNFTACVALHDAKVLQTAGPLSKVSANVNSRDWIVIEGVQRVGPGVEIVAVSKWPNPRRRVGESQP